MTVTLKPLSETCKLQWVVTTGQVSLDDKKPIVIRWMQVCNRGKVAEHSAFIVWLYIYVAFIERILHYY